MMMGWEAKAHRIIAQASFEAWRAANHDRSGKRYARHRPYSIPDDARRLVEILGWRDRKSAEIEAKALFQALAFRSIE